MRQITLSFPELPELAGRTHTDLPNLLGQVPTDDHAKVYEAEELCQMWVDPEFMKLLNVLQLDGRLPELGNIDARTPGKRIVYFDLADGFSVDQIKTIIQKAWDATLQTYAEAFYKRVVEIIAGSTLPTWVPDDTTEPPHI